MLPDNIVTIIAIAVGLAMDCFAVSVTRGLVTRKGLTASALTLAASFGAFQAGMCLLGWQLGEGFVGLISGFDHWIAFILLAVVGLKMMRGSGEDGIAGRPGMLSISSVLALSVATSIDSLAAGLGFAFLGYDVLKASLVIGAASFLFSLLGFSIGMRADGVLRERAEAAGGEILIAIGIKIVIEHMT